MDIKKKINTLKNQIIQWEYEYYLLDSPTVSDYEYDRSLKELEKLEIEHPQYKSKDSPTMRVGGFVSEKFNKIKHSIPMLSLSNAFNDGDLIKFDNDVKSFLTENTKYSYSIEPKIDGLSISLIYKDGDLFKAITRGDGTQGEDVTQNVITIRYIPLSINSKETIELRGEIFFDKENMKIINDSSTKIFANARNAAAGTIRNLDSSIVSKRRLNAIIYSMPDALSHNINKQSDVLSWLKENKFNVFDNNFICNSIEEVLLKIKWFNENKEKIPYDIDGIVIKLNEIYLYEEIGFTSKFPKWAIAYKFPPKIAIAKLLNINVSVGRTGKINYIGSIEKTNINGTIVEHATLHNFDYISLNDIRINDYVQIYKAGEIIPKIIGPIIEKRNGDQNIFVIPTKCPSCNSELKKIDNDVDIYCLNDNCDRKKIELINHFVSRNAMNIEGISIKIIEKLYKNNILNNILDIFYLEEKKDVIINLDLQLKEKTMNNIIKQVNLSKKNSLERLIFGLGIRHIGEVASISIAKKYKSLEVIKNLNEHDSIKVNNLGEKMIKSLLEYFKDEKNMKIINELINLKIAYDYKSGWDNIEINENNLKYVNKKMVITGSFSTTRNYIKSLLQEVYGIKIVSKISPSVDYLLIGSNPTIKKIEEASKYKIETIDLEFWK